MNEPCILLYFTLIKSQYFIKRNTLLEKMNKQSHQSEYSIVEWGAPRKNHPSSGLHQPWKILLDLIKKKKNCQ